MNLIRYFQAHKLMTALGLIIIVGGSYFFYHRSHAAADTTKYVTGTVQKGTITASVSGTGNVVAANSVKVSPSITGTVYNLSVNLGDQVKKGQLLFKIQNDALDVNVSKSYANYLQAKQAVASAQVQLTTAQNNQTTVNSKTTSTDADKTLADQQVTLAQAALDTANQNVTATWGDYQQQKANAAARTVTAPIDGTITTLNIGNGDQMGSNSATGASSSGSSATSSSTAPVIIDDLSSLKASIQINEVDAPSVQAGQKATMTFDAIDGLTLTGKVEKIDTVGTVSNGVVTYGATINFDAIDQKVRPGMSVSTAITTAVKQDVLFVPNSAVKSSGNISTVQEMQNGQPTTVTVQTGIANDTNTEITSGLTEGQTIVTQTITSTSTTSRTTNSTSSLRIPGLGGGGGLGGNRSGN